MLSNGPTARSGSVANAHNKCMDSQYNIAQDIFENDAMSVDDELQPIRPSSSLMITTAQPPTAKSVKFRNVEEEIPKALLTKPSSCFKP